MPYKDIEKQREAQKQWARRNRNITNKHRKAHQRKNRERVRRIKESSPCSDCGNCFHFAAMQFDHVRGDKKGDVAGMVSRNRSWDSVKAEIGKCELVCANCHAVRTYERLMEDTAEVVGNES